MFCFMMVMLVGLWVIICMTYCQNVLQLLLRDFLFYLFVDDVVIRGYFSLGLDFMEV